MLLGHYEIWLKAARIRRLRVFDLLSADGLALQNAIEEVLSPLICVLLRSVCRGPQSCANLGRSTLLTTLDSAGPISPVNLKLLQMVLEWASLAPHILTWDSVLIRNVIIIAIVFILVGATGGTGIISLHAIDDGIDPSLT